MNLLQIDALLIPDIQNVRLTCLLFVLTSTGRTSGICTAVEYPRPPQQQNFRRSQVMDGFHVHPPQVRGQDHLKKVLGSKVSCCLTDVGGVIFLNVILIVETNKKTNHSHDQQQNACLHRMSFSCLVLLDVSAKEIEREYLFVIDIGIRFNH